MYGLDDIGKIQIVLEYVYVNQIYYQRIYWVSTATYSNSLDDEISANCAESESKRYSIGEFDRFYMGAHAVVSLVRELVIDY